MAKRMDMNRIGAHAKERSRRSVRSRIIEDDGLFLCMEGTIVRDDLPKPYVVTVNWPHDGNPEKTLAKFNEELVRVSHLPIDPNPRIDELEQLKQRFQQK
jgi:hypothetical protein